jgi:hypothetical protein
VQHRNQKEFLHDTFLSRSGRNNAAKLGTRS